MKSLLAIVALIAISATPAFAQIRAMPDSPTTAVIPYDKSGTEYTQTTETVDTGIDEALTEVAKSCQTDACRNAVTQLFVTRMVMIEHCASYVMFPETQIRDAIVEGCKKDLAKLDDFAIKVYLGGK